MRKYSSLLVFFFSALIVNAQNFTNGQAARAVFGQTNFTAGNPSSSQTILGGVSGLAYYNGILYVADSNRVAATPNNSRIMAFQTAEIPGLRSDLTALSLTNPDCYLCGFPAYLTLGQSTFSPTNNPSCPASSGAAPCFTVNRSQSGMANATGVATDGHYFAVADTDNNRVLLWNEIPSTINQNADIVLGQTGFTTFKSPQVVDKTSLRGPQGVWIQNNHLFVADTQNNRVLIWNTIPTQNNQGADVVLGQNDFNHNYAPPPTNTSPTVAANQLENPTSISADATHVFVADTGFNRVLIWNEIPTQNAQNADLVIGQPDMTQSVANNINVCNGYAIGPLLGQCQFSLNYPRFVLSNGTKLFIADGGNDRVLIYNSIPKTNAVAADAVLGEPDFLQDVVSSASISIASTAIDNTGGVDLLPTPQALAWDGTNLYVSDPYNRRVVVFTPGDNALSPNNSVVNWASAIIRQEGIVQISVPSGGTITAGDTITVTIQSQAYTYTVVKGDTIDTIAQGLVKLINADTANNGPTAPAGVTAIFDGTGAGTLYLSSNTTNLPFDSITLTVAESNSANELATASGAYLSGGTAATGAIGMLVQITPPAGATFTLADNTAAATLDGVTPLPNTLGGVQVYMDGYACPILKVSPTQIVTQIPYFYSDRNSTSVYVRTVHSDGSVTVTNAVPVYVAPANPGIFSAQSAGYSNPPFLISQAYHQAGNATDVIDFEGVPTLGNTATITIAGVPYTYTVNAADVTSAALTTITQGLVTLINATDTNVTASLGGAFNRIVLTAKLPGAAGNGISVTTASATSATNTAAGNLTLTNYNSNNVTCCLVTPNSPIIPTNPAAPGELIQITGAGLGLITDPTNVAGQQLGTGVPYAGPANNNATNFVNATMGGTTAQVIYASLPKGSYGTYNVQMVVPTNQPTLTNTTLTIAQNAFISNTVYIPVGPAVATYVPPPPVAPATTITEIIDSPSASQTETGTFIAYGWALNSVSAISAVTVSIDGKPLSATPTIHLARPDVCSAGFSSPDCPNVGWYLPVDTTQFADGLHTLSTTAISVNGSAYTISQLFYVSNHPNPASDPFHGFIDAPGPNYVYRGVVNFGGWATYANAAVAGVSIYVDGNPLGAATYGAARPDVCAVYSTPGCPNVGWSFQVDTNTLGNGNHTLVAKAVSADGHTLAVPQPFQVQNYTGVTTTQAIIDSPSAGSAAFSGTLTLYGWAYDANAAVTSVGVTVDGVSFGNAVYGSARPDVCTALSLASCPGLGYYASIDTTFLADGQHLLGITVNLAAGQSQTVTRLFTVGNELSLANPLIGYVDTPQINTVVSGAFAVSGWAISQADPITIVSLKIDGNAVGNATYGAARPDVCSAFPGAASCPNVGWNATLSSALLANGQHILEITMSTASGHRVSANTPFQVANPTTGPGRISIDSPGPASNPFQGLAMFSGWALNDHAAVNSVSITLDGVPYGKATYGLSRPDVCGVYPGRPGCPNVGWSFGVDTTRLTDGSHTLGVIENNSDGSFYSSQAPFTVANNSIGNPLLIFVDSPTTAYGIFGNIIISGWAVDPNAAIKTIQLAVDGVSIGNASYGTSRPDVCAVQGSPSCPNVGWSFIFNTAYLPNGIHTLDVTAITVTGQSATSTEQFAIAN